MKKLINWLKQKLTKTAQIPNPEEDKYYLYLHGISSENKLFNRFLQNVEDLKDRQKYKELEEKRFDLGDDFRISIAKEIVKQLEEIKEYNEITQEKKYNS